MRKDKIIEIIKEEIISNEDSYSKVFYDNREYNDGQREVVKLPSNLGKNLLYNSSFQFKRLMRTSDSTQDVVLLYNGREFAIVVRYNNVEYNAPLEMEEYIALKDRYENNGY